MKKYEIIKLNSGEQFDYLVLSLTYESLTSFLDELIKKTKNKNCSILFDTLLVNAQKSNRYISVSLKNGKIVNSSFKTIKESLISPNIVSLSWKYFNLNKRDLNKGVLNIKEKEEFMNNYKSFCQ